MLPVVVLVIAPPWWQGRRLAVLPPHLHLPEPGVVAGRAAVTQLRLPEPGLALAVLAAPAHHATALRGKADRTGGVHHHRGHSGGPLQGGRGLGAGPRLLRQRQ